MSVKKLFAATTGDGAAAMDINQDGWITGVWLEGFMIGTATSDYVEAELSFASSSGFTTNDTRASIAGLSMASELTAGALTITRDVTISNLRIPVTAGERFYLHLRILGASTYRVRAWVYIDDDEDKRPATRRR